MNKKVGLILIILIAVPLILCGCGSVSYRYIRGTDGSVCYDVLVEFEQGELTEEEVGYVFTALEETIKILPLYSEEHTSFIYPYNGNETAFLYREYYRDLDELYAARGYTGWELPVEDDSGTETNKGLFTSYTSTDKSIFAVLDETYANNYYSEAELAESPTLQAYYRGNGIFATSESGLENILLLFADRLYAISPSTVAKCKLFDAPNSSFLLNYVYATEYKSITSNATSTEFKDFPLSFSMNDTDPAKEEKFGLYYHTWSYDLADYSADSLQEVQITLTQTVPRVSLWYLLLLPCGVALGAVVWALFSAFSKIKHTTHNKE